MHDSCERGTSRRHPEDVDLELKELICEFVKPLEHVLARSIFDREVLAFHIPELLQALEKRPQLWGAAPSCSGLTRRQHPESIALSRRLGQCGGRARDR